MKKRYFYFAAFLLLIGGCAEQKSAQEAIYDPELKINVHFCPVDDCQGIMEAVLEIATSSIYCALYELDNAAILNVLGTKSRSISVGLIIDEEGFENQIQGDAVKIDKSANRMHDKFCVIDLQYVITGSTNPTNNDLKLNNNNLIIIHSSTVASWYKEEFDELWNELKDTMPETKNIYSNTTKLSVYFCPEDKCDIHLQELLSSASKSIDFMTFAFTDDKVTDALLVSNVPLRGIIETRNINLQGSEYERLLSYQIPVIKDKNPRTMHHKVFIADNAIVATGSYNPTKSGSHGNDENMLIIQNEQIAAAFSQEFERLWSS